MDAEVLKNPPPPLRPVLKNPSGWTCGGAMTGVMAVDIR